MSDEPFTRDSFIADDHVQVAISNLKTIWSEDEGPFKEIPMPQSIKESGVLPEGYCVGMSLFISIFKTRSSLIHHIPDFAHDPATTIYALASVGIRCPRYDIIRFRRQPHTHTLRTTASLEKGHLKI